MTRFARAIAVGALTMLSVPGCSKEKAAMFEGVQTDIATLGKFVTLRPAPVEARWTVTTIGTDAVPGPSDTIIWAVLRYSDEDFAAVADAMRDDRPASPISVDAPPAWLLADADLARFRNGSGFIFDGPVSAGRPFASDLYSTGLAVPLGGHRVLIRFASR